VFSVASPKEDLLSEALATDDDLSEVLSEPTSCPFKLFYSFPHPTTTSPRKPFFYLDDDFDYDEI
jgi:hypothetical protein